MLNANISIFRSGDKARQSIVFIHGFPFDHTMWDVITADLSKDFYCITYDVKGLGESDPGDGQYTIESFATDLFDVIEKEKLNKPIICALSMGGYIALRAVERNQDKFSALILCDTKAEADNNQAKLKRAQGINIINTKGLRSYLNEFIPTCFNPASIEKLGSRYDDIFKKSSGYSPAGVKGCLLAMAGRTDTTHFLSDIRISTLIICGEKDNLSTPDIMKEMADKIKGSRFVLIPGSGHMTPVERPELVLSAMRSFLKDQKT